ncbi:hypothetical protein HDU97_000028 [Phlyctochytrium planicorne]|nr:hypothetical protein HDU97_000028 [Phlyctochytrium planicorne]
MTVGVLRATLEKNKDSIKVARQLTSLGSAPSPVQVRIEKVRIPRCKECLPENMNPKDAEGTIKAEWMDYHKKGLTNDDNRVILYLHGGAYIICNRKSHRGITWRVAKHSRSKVFVLDYRLAPENVFPLALQDALSAYIYLTDPAGGKYKPNQVVIMGDSAGGGLAMATMLWLRDHPERGWGMPAGLALLSPWLDLTQSMPSFQLHHLDYLPPGSNDPLYINENRSNYYVSDNSFLKNPYVSPLFAKEDPEKPTCPTMIHVGGVERLRDEILHFCSDVFPNSPIQLEVYDDMVHVFQMLAALLRISDVALKRIGIFIQSVTSPNPPVPNPTTTMIRIAHSKGYPESVLTPDEARKLIAEGFKVLNGEKVEKIETGGKVEGDGDEGLEADELEEVDAIDAQLDAIEDLEREEGDGVKAESGDAGADPETKEKREVVDIAVEDVASKVAAVSV